MAGPTTPEQRREGLRRARWIAAGASAGAAVLLTGTIAVVHAAPSGSDHDGSTVVQRERAEVDDDEYAPAVPAAPVPRYQVPQPQTRSRGS